MIYNIQFARAVAAMLVVFAHIGWPGFIFGHFGVDIFFVISGYIMTMICVRSTKHFFTRRLVRIVPLYWFVTLAVFALTYIKPELLNSTRSNWGNLAKSLTFVPYAKENGTIHPVLDVGWTLNYEMYFYALIALALLVVRPAFATLAATGVMIIIQIACYAALRSGLDAHGTMGVLCTFYSSYHIEQFLLGAIVFFAASQAGNVHVHPAFLLLVALACLVYLAVHQLYLFGPASETLSITLPAGLFIFSLLLLEQEKFVITKLTLLGDASYALYLTNQFVVEGYKHFGAKLLHLPIYSVPGCLLVMVMAAVVSIIVFKVVERPMHDTLRKYV